jgi:signal transduction histidine kinase
VKKKKTEELFERKFEKLRSSLRRSLPHEIRTPLNAILGYSSVMANNFDTITKDEFKEMMNGINSSAKRLHELLEKFLLYAKLELIDSNPEEKKLLAKKMTHSAKILIHEIAEYKARSYNRVSDITKKITDTTINISEEYLIRIIEELVDNAMKFSNPGTPVEISTFKTVIDYFITIKDFGRGFSPEQVNEIGAYLQFDRKFYEQQGSGLGLTIVKKIIDLHYGTFKIESDLGKGTRITISLPLEQS